MMKKLATLFAFALISALPACCWSCKKATPKNAKTEIAADSEVEETTVLKGF